MAPLASIYADAQHYDLLAQMTAPPDLPFYRRLVQEHGGPVLEIGCGTGRVLLELCKRGVEGVGVDRAAPLLARAAAKAAASGLAPRLVEADFRDFDLGRTFPLVLFPYNAFNHLLELEDVDRCLSSLRRHMDGESLLVIDTFNPDPTALCLEPKPARRILRYLDPPSGEEVILYETNAYDAATQVNRITWSYCIGGREGARVDELRMRVFFPRELDALLRGGGFAMVDKLGDYDGKPFGARTPKQLMLCRRAVS
jgi:SAM-dependent methyltransferase